MTFQYTVLAANSTQLPAMGGTVNDIAMRALDENSKAQNSTLSAVMPGTTFYAARCSPSSCILPHCPIATAVSACA